jgi:hypothetical protein
VDSVLQQFARGVQVVQVGPCAQERVRHAAFAAASNFLESVSRSFTALLLGRLIQPYSGSRPRALALDEDRRAESSPYGISKSDST